MRVLFVSLSVALLLATPAWAALPEGGAVDFAREAWVPALTGADHAARFAALDEMRADPDLARQALLLGITDPTGPKDRWRLIRHLPEFGQPEDLPALLALLERPDPRDRPPQERAALPERIVTPIERRFLWGAVLALYPRFEAPADLSPLVSEFIFLQTRPPQPFDSAREGQWLLGDRAYEEFHRAGVPLDLIQALKPLRERPFADRAGLLAAMQRLATPADWRQWQETLALSLAPLPPRVVLEGLLRVRLANRTERPLLVRATFGTWRARFESAPPPGLIYAKPGEEARYEIPARLIAPAAEAPARIDLRLREIHRDPQPLYRKLLIPTLATETR